MSPSRKVPQQAVVFAACRQLKTMSLTSNVKLPTTIFFKIVSLPWRHDRKPKVA
jgi:hypothetical protein